MTTDSLVLCVDDDPAMLDLTATYLERDGRFTVETATDAATALDRLGSTPRVDAIVSDYQMPAMDGLAFLERVRAAYGDRPFILFTGKGSEEIASQAISDGVTDYLQKRGAEQYDLLTNRLANAIERDATRERLYREREVRTRILEASPIGIVGHDTDGEVLFRNSRAEEILAAPTEALRGASYPNAGWLLYDLNGQQVPPESLPYRRVTETGDPLDGVEYQLRAVDGTVKPLRIYGSPLTDGGEITGAVIAYFTDDSDRRFQELADLSPDGVFRLDREGRFTYVSDRALELLGTDDPEAVMETHFTGYVDAESERVAAAGFARVMDGETIRDLELTLRRLDGGTRVLSIHGRPLYEGTDLVGLVGFGHDITEQKERERKLERSQARYEALVDSFPRGGVFLFDTDRRYTVVGGEDLAGGGLTPEMMIGRTPSQIFPPENAALLERAYSDALAGNEHVFEDSFVGRDYRVHVVPLRDPDGEVEAGLAVAVNVTGEKERERQLRRNRTRYEALVDSYPNGGVFFFDTDLQFTRVGGAEFATAGFTLDEVIGKTPRDLFEGESGEQLAAAYRRTIDGESVSFETTWGDQHYEVRTVPLHGDDGAVSGGLAVAQNVTERTHRERELQRQRDRLEAFTGVVSHDLRNPLAIASGHLSLLAEECESTHLGPIQRALDRMDRLIADLLTVARDGDGALTPTTVGIEAAAASAWRNVRTAEASLAVLADRRIAADPSRLGQLFENCFRNAVEHAGPDVVVTVGALDDGLYVEDDGPGIPEAERERVLDLGYSTDERGIGLGLAIVADVAAAHGWTLAVTEGAAGGARFEVRGVEFVE